MKKTLAAAFFLLFFGCKSQDTTVSLYRTVSPKNPGVAFTLSTFIPGAGIMYNDQVKLGMGVLAAEGLLLYSGYSLLQKYNTDDEYHLEINLSVANGLMASAAIIHLGQMFYAALYAEHWNKKHGFGKKNMDRLKVGLNGAGMGVSYEF